MVPELYKIRETKYNQRENTLSSEYRDREKIREITRIERSARTTDSELPKVKSDKAREQSEVLYVLCPMSYFCTMEGTVFIPKTKAMQGAARQNHMWITVKAPENIPKRGNVSIG